MFFLFVIYLSLILKKHMLGQDNTKIILKNHRQFVQIIITIYFH